MTVNVNHRFTPSRASREVRNTYRTLNDSARTAEQDKEWQEASTYWSKAATFATNPTEARYCLRRAEFCTAMAKRGLQHD